MKIAIDGFNLGQLQGTGISNYSKELASLLTNAGHDVYPIFGLDGINKNKKINNSEFIQKLAIRGESSRRDILRWANTFFCGAGRHLFGIPFRANYIQGIDQLALGSAKDKIPSYRGLYNAPSIFRASQAYSFFTGKVTKLLLAEPMDIFHSTCPLPLSIIDTPKVVTIHDLIPIILPASTEVNIRHYLKIITASIQDASAIFCVSEASRIDLLKYFDIPSNKIHVTYQSADLPTSFYNISNDEVEFYIKNLFNLKYGQYFIFYGSIEPKKNVARIIESFARARTDLPIVIVGKNGWLFDDVDKLLSNLYMNNKNRRRFIRIPYLSFHNLMYLLKGAKGLVFPSLYEGFGLPVLEAMQMGCPVITSNISSLPEVGGDAVHYVDPYDICSIASAIDKFSFDESYVKELIKRGYIQAEKFSRQKYIERLNTGYFAAMR